MRKLIIMFDLEQTLIDSWNSGCVLFKKVSHIKSLIPINDRDIDFGIFSFAVDNQDEVQQGINLAEMATGFKMNPIFCNSWIDFEKLVNVREHIQKWEIVSLFGKHGMFDLWTRQFPEHDFVLFDDCLPDKDNIMTRESQTIIKIRV